MNQCTIFARGCIYAGDDVAIRITTKDDAGADVTATAAATCWTRLGDTAPTIDLNETDPQITLASGYVEVALGAVDTAITPGSYDVWYTIVASGYTRRGKQRIEVADAGCSA